MRSPTLNAGLIAALIAAATPAFAGNGNLIISNESLWNIHQMYISEADESEWGPDQLEDDILETDQRFTLRNVPCGSYDIKIVDEDSDVCILADVDICGAKSTWTITNESLLSCQGDTE